MKYFANATSLLALIIINVIVFVAMTVCHLAGVSEILSPALVLSSDPATIVTMPWTLVSYSFVNADVMQLIFNMLWLYCFGRLLLMRLSPANLWALYVCGALGGGLAFVGLYHLFHYAAASVLLGSSAAVIAVSVAVAILMPDKELFLPLFGNVRIKWIVIAVVVLFSLGLSAPNAGGNLAHLGGAATGAIYVLALRCRKLAADKDDDIVEYRRLVDKIRLSGYEALTSREKRRFFELSGNETRQAK